MKLRNTLVAGAAALALAATGANAQQILTLSGTGGPGFNQGYSDDNLVLSFYSAADASQGSGANSQGDVLFNLGTASSFTGLAAGTYAVDGFNGSSTTGQPTVGFGSTELNSNLTVPSSSTFWTVVGSDQNTNELWLTGTTTETRQSASVQNTLAGIIGSIGSAGAGTHVSDSTGFDSSQTTYNNINAQNKWPNFPAVAANSVSSSSNQLGLYQLLPGTGSGGSTTELGYFTLTDSSGSYSLTFTAIPEPSTYAAILGALTVGFVLVRRRFGANRLSAAA